MKDQRSTIAPENLQGILDAATSIKAATQTGQQQYSTPPKWAEFFASLLPNDCPAVVFDPQCARGNLLTHGFGWSTDAFGWDIDARFEDDSGHRPEDGEPNSYGKRVSDSHRLTINCVKAWELLDELWPDLRFECQVANPPFGLRWKLPTRPAWLRSNAPTPAPGVDSTAHTWQKITERAAASGHGYFIAAAATIERLGIDKHPWVYLYQKFPKGFFPHTEVEPGVVHWKVEDGGRKTEGGKTAAASRLIYRTLEVTEHADALEQLKATLHAPRSDAPTLPTQPATAAYKIKSVFAEIREILAEEKRNLSPWNIWLDPDGMLRIHLSTRTVIKRKLSREEILRLTRIDHCHPLTLVIEAETRKLLKELPGGTVVEAAGAPPSFYTIEPAAAVAIASALAEVESLATPIMPVTDFERVAYADELETLKCKSDFSISEFQLFSFSPGSHYPMKTRTYTFVQKFERDKVHFDEELQKTFTARHTCELSGQDRYIAIVDDEGVEHRFMDRPSLRPPSSLSPLGEGRGEGARRLAAPLEHCESLLWQIFEAPVVRTVADAHPERLAENLAALKLLEERINR